MLQDVVTGFLLPELEKVLGRPVGLAIEGTGPALVADDAGTTVWRVVAADGRISDLPFETARVAVDPGAAATAAPTEGAAPSGEDTPVEPAARSEAPADAAPAEPPAAD
jgi:hypothetical protein